jgi:hypothetical protein
MADHTNSKPVVGVYPEGVKEAPWGHVEPLITPEQLRARHLFGIPLVSQLPNPITKQVDVMTDELLKDIIVSAVEDVETKARIHIMPVAMERRLPLDRQEFQNFAFFRLPDRPIVSIERLAIASSDDVNFFNFPLEWVEVGQLHRGQINILPLSPATTTAAFASLSGSPGFLLTQLAGIHWIPSYFTAKYTAGFKDGEIPRVVNDLIGVTAAISVLGMLSATYVRNSTSLSIDGMSQSISGPGPDTFLKQMQNLEDRRAKLVKNVRALFGTGIVIGSV